jgi:flavin-dependent dehydrogenase
MRKNDFDIAIIGGGPAGSTAAIHISRAGLKVCLFEKKTFPREVLCGEFLSAEVIESLKKLNLYNKFLLLNPNRINSFRFINEDSSELETKFQFEAYSMKRSVLDNFLLNEAKKSGAKIFQPAEVKEIEKQGASFRLNILNGQGCNEEISSDFVIAAYGKQNILDKKLDRGFTNERSHLNGIKFHIDKKYLSLFPEDEIQIYASQGIYCGVNSVSESEVTLCFLEDRNNYSDSARSHLVSLMDRNDKFADIFNKDFLYVINEIQVYGTGNIFFGRKELVEDGIFMIGDAAGVIAPLAGDGIGMAMETAELLAGILINGSQNKLKPKILERQYVSDWKGHFKKRLFSAGIVQKLILTNNLRKAGIGLVNIFPTILPKIVQLTRG